MAFNSRQERVSPVPLPVCAGLRSAVWRHESDADRKWTYFRRFILLHEMELRLSIAGETDRFTVAVSQSIIKNESSMGSDGIGMWDGQMGLADGIGG